MWFAYECYHSSLLVLKDERDHKLLRLNKYKELNANISSTMIKQYELQYFYQMNQQFTYEMDCEICLLIRRYKELHNISPTKKINFDEMKLSNRILSPYHSLEKIDNINKIKIRMIVLTWFSEKFKMLLPFVDLCLPFGYSQLTDDVRSIRNILLWSIKKHIYDLSMSLTVKTTPSLSSVHIDRFKALRIKQKNKCDLNARKTIFGQLFRLLKDKDIFRVTRTSRALKVSFAGEHSTDVGGPYRQMITDICDELQSSRLPLFIPCPNNRAKVGMNQEKWVPTPSNIRPLYLQLYEFIGKLMGLAMRSGDFLNLDLPSIIWKNLVDNSHGITKNDVLKIDILSYKILDIMESLASNVNDLNDQDIKLQFESMNVKFEIIASDQKLHNLIDNGNNILVNWDNKDQYIQLSKEYRLNEFKLQCEAMRKGLATVIPFGVISLFTAKELEIEICGNEKIDVDLLERNTIYDSTMTTDDQVIIMFWKMMREKFDDQDRAAFLRFVWGRSRLPLVGDRWEKKI